jgi:succinoglycan biosynthesis transport protein ExoP
MASISEGNVSGARIYARLGHDRAVRPPQAIPEAANSVAVETITLNRIGDFLELDFGRLYLWLRKGVLAMATAGLLGAVAGGAFGVMTPPRFTVSTDLLIDPTSLKVVGDDLYQQSGQNDSGILAARSKLRVLTSGNVFARVVDTLGLTADTEFYDPTPHFSLGALLGKAPSNAEPSDPRNAAIAALAKKVDAKADDGSFVASLKVTTLNGDKSMRIADAMVTAFREELAKAEADGAARTAQSLNDRLDALKSAATDAEQKVVDYRKAHGLAASSSGELVSTQTMSQIATQVIDAQSRLISAQSAYDEIVAAGQNASSNDPTTATSLSAVRAKVADLKSQLESQSRVYGPRHPAITKLQSELGNAQTELNQEIGRLVGGAKAAVDEARTALAALEGKQGTLESSVFSDNALQVGLRELERDAASKVTIYEAFLSRAREVTEREQIDTSNVRVISTPLPPTDRSWPPSTPVLVILGLFGGIVAGALASIVLGIRRDLKAGRQSGAA